MKKNWNKIAVVVVVFSCIMVFSWPKIFGAKKEKTAAVSTKDAKKQVVSVKILKIIPSQWQQILSLEGSLVAGEQADIAAEVPGLVSKIYFKEGQFVTKGQLLLTLSDAQLQAQYARAKQLLVFANINAARQKNLLSKQAASQQEYDQAETQQKVAATDVRTIKTQIQKTRILAPFSGHIGFKRVAVGSYLASGQKIVSLLNSDPIYIEFAVPARYAPIIRKGMNVGFTIENLADTNLGQVFATSAQIDRQARTLTVRASTPNPNQKLIAGSFATVLLALKDTKNNIFVPSQALVPTADGYQVFICKNLKSQAKKVITGQRNVDQVQILSGLEPSDSLIISGVQLLRPNMDVRISK